MIEGLLRHCTWHEIASHDDVPDAIDVISTCSVLGRVAAYGIDPGTAPPYARPRPPSAGRRAAP
jgi:hypothetical protein